MTVKLVLRWIAVLPGAVLAAILARTFSYYVGWIFFPSDLFFWQFVVGLQMGVATVFIFVVAGAWIAPSNRNATGAILATLNLLVVGISLFSASILPTSIDFTDSQVLGDTIGWTVASVLVLVMAWRKEIPSL